MYTQIQDGTETRFAANRMWEMDDRDLLKTKAYIKEMDDGLLFRSKLLKKMIACGYTSSMDDNEAALKFLLESCNNAGVAITPNTIRNWVRTGKVAHSKDGRKNIYKLCFALRMDVDETEEFFMKAVLERPFNYKDLYEAVCYFCLNTGRGYSDVERLVTEIEGLKKQENSNSLDFTIIIRGDIKAFRREDELIEYWLQRSAGFSPEKQSAKEEVTSLLDKCYKVATAYYGYTIKNPDSLLKAIYGYSARSIKKGEKRYPFSIFKSDFPAAIKRNFTHRQQIQNILNANASDEVIRKAIVILSFFLYYAEDEIRRREPDKYKQPENGLFDDFREELDTRLEKYGLVKLYWRNPFDWMFGYCALQEEPICMLQELIEKFYTEGLFSPFVV